MNLPQEIVDQIVSLHIVEEPSKYFWQVTPSDVWGLFTSPPGQNAVKFWDSRGHYKTNFYLSNLQDIRSLLAIRLISRRWNFSVCRLLQKHKQWNLKFDEKHTLEQAVECCEREDGGTSGWIRNLSLGAMGDLQTFERFYSYCVEISRNQDIDDDNHTILDTYVDRLTAAARSIAFSVVFFDKLVNIEHFSVGFPRARSQQGLRAECYDIQGVDEVVTTVQYGLRSSAFQYLVDLSLAIPSTWHVGKLASALSQDARDRLSHLKLVILDETGPSGSVDYTMVEIDDYDGDMVEIHSNGYTPSNVQVAYPNRGHQADLWVFVASCRNLESLAIEATHYLQLELLEWSPASGSRGLRNISLRRLWANATSILRLLSASPGSNEPPAARRVVLKDVKIYENGGNWEDVFEHLRTRCPDLELFSAEQLSYYTGHPRYQRIVRPWENCPRIWTGYGDESNNDRRILRMVIKELIQRTGLIRDHHPVYYYDTDTDEEE